MFVKTLILLNTPTMYKYFLPSFSLPKEKIHKIKIQFSKTCMCIVQSYFSKRNNLTCIEYSAKRRFQQRPKSKDSSFQRCSQLGENHFWAHQKTGVYGQKILPIRGRHPFQGQVISKTCIDHLNYQDFKSQGQASKIQTLGQIISRSSRGTLTKTS